MSKLTEIQTQYQGYVAAKEAVEMTRPEEVEVVYKNDENGDPRYNGIVVYDPRNNTVIIRSQCFNITSGINIKPEDIPALIKALREFIE
jgi:hypothetical protein